MAKEAGRSENGRFYLGEAARERLTPRPRPGPLVLPVDPDAPDELNARRFFQFTDNEEIDLIRLRARCIQRWEPTASALVRETVRWAYSVLAAELDPATAREEVEHFFRSLAGRR
jgi:hypothetical protein